jgi:hypothetical protein
MRDPGAWSVYLWLFTLLFFLRVLGQVVVVLWAPRWLPPMRQWQSGLLPYPTLLASQLAILALMAWIAIDFTRGAGLFVRPRPEMGRFFVWVGYVYAAGMAVRYAVRMARRPDQRWFGGTIPIVFHCVLAAFIWTFGRAHRGP